MLFVLRETSTTLVETFDEDKYVRGNDKARRRSRIRSPVDGHIKKIIIVQIAIHNFYVALL